MHATLARADQKREEGRWIERARFAAFAVYHNNYYPCKLKGYLLKYKDDSTDEAGLYREFS